MPMLEGLRHDVAFAVRSLRRRVAFAATSLLTLALGIGATTAMFSVVDGVLLRPLPFREPAQLVTMYTTFPHWRGTPLVGPLWNRLRTPYPDYVRLLNGQRAFQTVAGFEVSSGSLGVADATFPVEVGSGTANLLSTLGVSVARGRWFLPGEDGPTAGHLVVLSDEVWQERFGGSPMMGKTVDIDEEPFTVIGVLPRGFALTGQPVETSRQRRADLWIPFGVYPSSLQPNNHTLELIGRLRPGVSLTAALADAEPLLRGDRPVARRGARIVPRAEVETGDVERPLSLLFAAVGVLLLITCGNVAMLFSSECAVREPELRTRAMLGAGRGRLARLLMAESAVIAAGGALAGVLLAWWGTRVMLSLAPIELPHASMVHMSVRVCLFTAVVAALVALLSGLIPAFTLTHAESRSLSGAGAAGSRVAAGRSHMQSAIIALQACVSVVLVTGAGLLARSLMNQRRVQPGFAVGATLVVAVDLPASLGRTDSDRRTAYDEIANVLARLPGVTRVTATSAPPLSGRTNGQAVTPRPDEKLSQTSANAERAVVFSNYFDVLRIPVLAGRTFGGQDTENSPLVSVVSESFARRFWPGETAVGKRFRFPAGVATVVGVVSNVKNKSLDREPETSFYVAEAQIGAGGLSFLVETRGDPLVVAPAVQRAVWSTIPGATISDLNSMTALVSKALAPGRYRALLAGIFAALALLLTAVGVAGLTARAVAHRLRELCIRMALGATSGRTHALAIRQGLGAVVAGAVAGLALAPFASRWLAGYLYQVAPSDLATSAATVLTTMLVCVGATVVATRQLRAADVVRVLRDG